MCRLFPDLDYFKDLTTANQIQHGFYCMCWPVHDGSEIPQDKHNLEYLTVLPEVILANSEKRLCSATANALTVLMFLPSS